MVESCNAYLSIALRERGPEQAGPGRNQPANASVRWSKTCRSGATKLEKAFRYAIGANVRGGCHRYHL